MIEDYWSKTTHTRADYCPVSKFLTSREAPAKGAVARFWALTHGRENERPPTTFNMEELVKRLESVDTQESAKAVSRLQKRLGSSREPQLLGELVDYFIASGSLRALRVLSSLKDVQSQVRHGSVGEN